MNENFIWTDLIFTWMFINQYVIIVWELNTGPNMKLSNWIYKFYTFAQKLQTITVECYLLLRFSLELVQAIPQFLVIEILNNISCSSFYQ